AIRPLVGAALDNVAAASNPSEGSVILRPHCRADRSALCLAGIDRAIEAAAQFVPDTVARHFLPDHGRAVEQRLDGRGAAALGGHHLIEQLLGCRVSVDLGHKRRALLGQAVCAADVTTDTTQTADVAA